MGVVSHKTQKFCWLLFQIPQSEKETTEEENYRGPQKHDSLQGQKHIIWQATQKRPWELAVQEGHCSINHRRSNLTKQGLQGKIMSH